MSKNQYALSKLDATAQHSQWNFIPLLFHTLRPGFIFLYFSKLAEAGYPELIFNNMQSVSFRLVNHACWEIRNDQFLEQLFSEVTALKN